GPDETAAIVDGAEVETETTLRSHVVDVWGEGLDLKNVRSFKVNGMPAVGAETMHKGVGHELVAVRIGPRAVYRFLFITRPVVTARYEKRFRAMVASFRKLSRKELNDLRPLKIQVVEVKQGDTVKRVARRMAMPDRQVERFRVLNGLDADAELQPGQRVKIIAN
ncbi:MAG: LysM peptidoglycan-binding domain-containing protein, partial [Hyphomicrobiales bacterium]